MAEQHRDPAARDETTDPQNPPNSVVNPEVRSFAFWSYVGPLLALFAVIAIALLYWMARPSGTDGDGRNYNPAVGTSGSSQTDRGRDAKHGGGDPAPRPDNARDEIDERGGNKPADRDTSQK